MRLSRPRSLAVLLALASTSCGLPDRGGAAMLERTLDVVSPPAFADQIGRDVDRIADVAERSVTAVVHIAATKRVAAAAPPALRFMLPELPDGMRQRGAGSGVIVDARGWILTNHHVVDGAEELTVTLSDGRRFDGTVKGTDAATDLALIELEGPVPRGLPALSFGDSDALRLGEIVLAIGSPFELDGTVTMGIVSAKGRSRMPGLADYQDYIQTDAAINPGNSGGALVDLDGRLVGINTAIRSQSGGYDGIGFAIPSNLARDIVGRLSRDGKVVRGFLGIGIADLDPALRALLDTPDGNGAVVSSVQPGSAAAAAGLEPYDVIVEVDGRPVRDAQDLRVQVSLKGAGAKVALGLLRDGKPRTATATLDGLADVAEGPPTAPPTGDGLLEGVVLAPLDGAQRQALGGGGVRVDAVAPSSGAAASGLRPGDVVVEVDRVPVDQPEALERALQGKRAVVLRVVGREGARLITLR